MRGAGNERVSSVTHQDVDQSQGNHSNATSSIAHRLAFLKALITFREGWEFNDAAGGTVETQYL